MYLHTHMVCFDYYSGFNYYQRYERGEEDDRIDDGRYRAGGSKSGVLGVAVEGDIAGGLNEGREDNSNVLLTW